MVKISHPAVRGIKAGEPPPQSSAIMHSTDNAFSGETTLNPDILLFWDFDERLHAARVKL